MLHFLWTDTDPGEHWCFRQRGVFAADIRSYWISDATIRTTNATTNLPPRTPLARSPSIMSGTFLSDSPASASSAPSPPSEVAVAAVAPPIDSDPSGSNILAMFQGASADVLAQICSRLTRENDKLKRELKAQKQIARRSMTRLQLAAASSPSTPGSVRSSASASPSSLVSAPLQDSIDNAGPQHAILLARQKSGLSLVSNTSSKDAFAVSTAALQVTYRTNKQVRITPHGQLSLALRWVMTNSAASDLASSSLLDTSRWTVVRSTVMAAASFVSWCTHIPHVLFSVLEMPCKSVVIFSFLVVHIAKICAAMIFDF